MSCAYAIREAVGRSNEKFFVSVSADEYALRYGRGGGAWSFDGCRVGFVVFAFCVLQVVIAKFKDSDLLYSAG